jgi:hypothetical protein
MAAARTKRLTTSRPSGSSLSGLRVAHSPYREHGVRSFELSTQPQQWQNSIAPAGRENTKAFGDGPAASATLRRFQIARLETTRSKVASTKGSAQVAAT